MPARRRQLSLYVPAEAARELEAVRRVVDPVQHRLIPAHLTLCREDELEGLPPLGPRLAALGLGPLTLRFGAPQAFSGHGLLLPCVGGAPAFRRLREAVLGSSQVRDQAPHLTLAHPRNPRAPGNSLLAAAGLPEVLTLTFPVLSLIEQEGQAPWRVLETHRLGGAQ